MSVFNGAVGHDLNSEAMKAASRNSSWVGRAGPVLENRKQKCPSVLQRPPVAQLEKRLQVHGISLGAKAQSEAFCTHSTRFRKSTVRPELWSACHQS